MEKNALQKQYWKELGAALFLYALAEVAKWWGRIEALKTYGTGFVAPLFFVLAVAFSIALPIFYRAWFANKVKHRKALSFAEYFAHEKKLLRMVLVTPYFLPVASIFQFPKFYYAGIVLLAMYSCYFYFPSQKRLTFERRLFRVEANP
ncbi:MAG: hypothetical protein D6814_11830 [Calditrichaeota bacterium]|nr:MAG: hypothetical protein D6814_11830 [Calditrichota bacterium]